jgi:hypothetical protein
MERQQTRNGQCVGRRLAAWAMGLALLPAVAAADTPVAAAPSTPKGRGFVWGAAIGAGSHSFPGGEGRVVALGPIHATQSSYGYYQATRSAKVVAANAVPADAELAVPLPASEGTGGFAMHAGYAFSPRAAVLARVGAAAGYDNGSINQVVGGVVVRFWPAGRLWLEAGPAFGDLAVGTDDGSTISPGSITGRGYQARVGGSVIRKPRWTLDLEGGWTSIGYDGFKSNTVTFAVGWTRLPL